MEHPIPILLHFKTDKDTGLLGAREEDLDNISSSFCYSDGP